EGTSLYLPARAWATLAIRTSLTAAPQAPERVAQGGPPDLLAAASEIHDLVLWWVRDGDRTAGPLVGAEVRDAVQGGRYRSALVCPLGTDDWVAIGRIFDRTLTDARRVALR